jgi:two-component system LytT family sensor kinase
MAPSPAGPEASRRASRRRGAALWLAVVGVGGLLLFLYHYLAALANRQAEPALAPFIEELTGAVVGGALFFPVRRLVRRLPLTAATWPRRLPIYLAALAACGATATTLMWGLRALLFPLAGLGPYDYGVMPLRYLMELPMQVIWFAAIVAALHLSYALAEARARELRAARVESSLARTQLRNLRLQLQPHFLFNALHTISAAMYEDPTAADEMLEQLAELLRSSLRTVQSDEVPLAEELALLERYLAIQRARFGDRLTVSIEIEEGAALFLVPSMSLQPLVENAIRHGNAERLGHGAVTVRATTAAGRLVLEVEDDGNAADLPATAPASPRQRRGTLAQRDGDAGLGLAATAERLQLLYGEAQTFTAGRRADGCGFLVRATLPLRLPEATGDAVGERALTGEA